MGAEALGDRGVGAVEDQPGPAAFRVMALRVAERVQRLQERASRATGRSGAEDAWSR